MGTFLNRVKNKLNNRDAEQKVNSIDRGATLICGDPRCGDLMNGTLTGADWTDISWIDVSTGEGAVTFHVGLVGEADASGDTSTADMDVQIFGTKGNASGPTTPGANTVEHGAWAAGAWTETTYRVTAGANAYQNLPIEVPCNSLKFGVRVRRHAGETSDIVYNVDYHLGQV